MKKKSDSHEGLSAMAHGDGVPPLIVMDGAKEQMMGNFRCKACQMGIHLKQTEHYPPWQNMAEGSIHEVKCGASWKEESSKSVGPLFGTGGIHLFKHMILVGGLDQLLTLVPQ